MTLTEFVEAYVPLELRHTRNFNTGRGWVPLANQLLKMFEMKGMFDLSRSVEIGVEVENKYYIDYPSDCIEILDIHLPPIDDYTEMERKYAHKLMDGKIKLVTPYDKGDDADSFTLSGGTTDLIIIDSEKAENHYQNYLLVPTDGSYTTPILLGLHDAGSGGSTTLNFIYTHGNAIDSTAGYITKQYLMLNYRKAFTGLTAYDDEIPLNDNFENIMAWGLCMLATPVKDTKQRREYKALFDEAIEDWSSVEFTPSGDQGVPAARSMPGLEDADMYDRYEFDYIGES